MSADLVSGLHYVVGQISQSELGLSCAQLSSRVHSMSYLTHLQSFVHNHYYSSPSQILKYSIEYILHYYIIFEYLILVLHHNRTDEVAPLYSSCHNYLTYKYSCHNLHLCANLTENSTVVVFDKRIKCKLITDKNAIFCPTQQRCLIFPPFLQLLSTQNHT